MQRPVHGRRHHPGGQQPVQQVPRGRVRDVPRPRTRPPHPYSRGPARRPRRSRRLDVGSGRLRLLRVTALGLRLPLLLDLARGSA
ncbi:hypothetical protein KCH_06920 [Kitasatospora cheerisanensis KCTC 2395]|uniref:Uncharacterized protein n=1 Tax=Kitasatospora cheerisanensis KCTC 2395 TaxID=1348663 RepID=A0A066Z251_9ACTN|nr:hypothetical protein KCH_06920 [Kitasatospora cheerisanensis KCTC 2395]